jgi:hypothetical protein
MKRTALFVLMLLVVFGCAGMTGCGSGGEEDAQPTPDIAQEEQEEEQESSSEQQASQSAGGFMWDDVPVYATAAQLQNASWSIPPQGDADYEKAEWRYYELPSAHDVGMVAMFYKMEMPKNGWQQMMEMEVQDVAMSFYTKNNEADAAYVWVASEDDKTVFALMRASK